MAFKVGVGKSDFAALREGRNYYVDKTDILYELIEETNNEVTLFTRPRRFGKTLMMSMMSNFFSIRKDSKDIFAGLKIAENTEFCEKWMNQYPVLFISFKDVEGETFEEAYDMLRYRLSEVCIELADIADSAEVDKTDKQFFDELKFRTPKKNEVKFSRSRHW